MDGPVEDIIKTKSRIVLNKVYIISFSYSSENRKWLALKEMFERMMDK